MLRGSSFAGLVLSLGFVACRADEVTASGEGISISSETSSETGTSATTDSESADADSGADESDLGIKFDLSIPDAAGSIEELPIIPRTCAEALMIQSSVGCSFHANKMQNFQEEPTSLVVGNVSDTHSATLTLYRGNSGGGAQMIGVPVVLLPSGTHEFVLSLPKQPGNVSVLRDGGAYRVESDRPVVAYQHSPIAAAAHNDSSMLIPDHALGRHHVVAAWSTNIGKNYSYFDVIGVVDDTLVEWEPRATTAPGMGVPGIAPFGHGAATIDAYDMLQVVATADVSGTILTTSEPAAVFGAVPCVNIPADITFCDHIEELMLPLEVWGDHYVAAHAPQRGGEHYWWRIYSGADAVTLTTDPPQIGTPVVLDRGEFIEFSTTESFIATADGPFMPVQYLEGQNGGAGTGDPASYQMVPTEQFLSRYVFVTGTGYQHDYVQIVRPQGAADVLVDGVLVTGYQAIGGFEVADWLINEGAHVAASAEPFGVVQVGYTSVTSYAYPGGLRLATINPDPEG